MEIRSQQNIKIECQKWLNPANVREVHQRHIQYKLDGTCKWIWTNDIFTTWLGSTSSQIWHRLLCISGVHGCGKSVLASSIIEGLNSDAQDTLMFYFSSTEDRSQTLNHLARSLIRQLIETSTGDAVSIVRDLMAKGPPTPLDLWKTIATLIALVANSSTIIMVIDGIDESSDLGTGFFNPVIQLLQDSPNLAIILLGRPHSFQRMSHPVPADHRMLNINPRITKEDTDSFITFEVDKSDLLRETKLKDNIVTVMQERSEGMFLWIRLMTEELRKSSSKFQVTERLKNLPRGLEETYDLVFSRIYHRSDQLDLLLIHITLAFITVARRQITVQELNFMYALELQSREQNESMRLEDFLLSNPEESVIRACGDLISVSDGFIRFIHSSLKDFLVRPESQWFRNDYATPMSFPINGQKTHALLGWQGLRYLDMGDYGHPLNGSDSLELIRRQNPLIEYAACHTMYHLRSSGSGHRHLIEKLDQISRSPRLVSWIEHVLVTLLENELDLTFVDDVEAFEDWLVHRPGVNEALLSRLIQGIEDTALQSFAESLIKHNCNPARLPACVESQDSHNQGATKPSNVVDQESFPAVSAGENTSQQSHTRVLESDNIPSRVTEIPSSPLNNSLVRHQTISLESRDTHTQSRQQIVELSRLVMNSAFPGLFTQKVTLFMKHGLTSLLQVLLHNAMVLPVYVLILIAVWLNNLERYDEALNICKCILRRAASSNTRIKCFTLAEMARSYEGLDQLSIALDHVEEGLRGYQPRNRMERILYLYKQDLMGYILDRMARYEDALRVSKDTVAASEHIFGQKHQQTLKFRSKIGRLLINMKRHEEARELLHEILKRQEKLLGKDHVDVLLTHDRLGVALYRLYLYKDALDCFENTCERRAKIQGECHLQSLWSSLYRGCSLSRLGLYEEARELLSQNLSQREQLQGKDHVDILDTHDELGLALFRLGLYADALECFENTGQRRAKIQGESDWRTLWAYDFKAHSLYNLGQFGEAIIWFRKAVSDVENCLQVSGKREVRARYFWLARSLAELGDIDEANVYFEKAALLDDEGDDDYEDDDYEDGYGDDYDYDDDAEEEAEAEDDDDDDEDEQKKR